eukprot:754358-Amphidinium_carterae.1
MAGCVCSPAPARCTEPQQNSPEITPCSSELPSRKHRSKSTRRSSRCQNRSPKFCRRHTRNIHPPQSVKQLQTEPPYLVDIAKNGEAKNHGKQVPYAFCDEQMALDEDHLIMMHT